MESIKMVIVAGARPNFMKVAPLMKAMARHNEGQSRDGRRIEARLVHTGQHYDDKMSEVFFRELGIPVPDVNLEVGSASHAVQTAQVMIHFEPVCLREKPDWVVVVGDVNSTLACTLVAAKLGIKVAHVEAGLRSFDRTMPEELNRIATDALADMLLTPSPDANANLIREGVPESRIRLVGNIMIDSLVAHLDRLNQSDVHTRHGLEARRYVFVTLHRPSNVDHRDALASIFEELSKLSKDWPIVFPIHPRTRKRLEEFGLQTRVGSGLKLIDPVGYIDSLALTRDARFVLTDSGGLQEESTYFRTPCLTLRANTERPVTVELGSNRLTSIPKLAEHIREVLSAADRLGQVPPLWDGDTARRTLAQIVAG